MALEWKGVMPAMTTCFKEDLSIDRDFAATHARWLVNHGCTGIVTTGSLGGGAPIVAAISSLSTAEAVRLAQSAADQGCAGLMVLPPYVYRSDWREMKAHVAAVMRATRLSCMLYNNPIAYGTDFLPAQIQELASEHENFQSVKQYSADVRRVTAIRAIDGEQLAVFVVVEDSGG